MNSEQILDALSLVDERYISESAPGAPVKKKHRWVRGLAIAACLCLVLAVAWDTLERFEYDFRAGCSAYPGTFVDGAYYFRIDHRGAYRYDPAAGGAPELVLSTYWEEDWLVNGYGVYYIQGLTFGVVPHETGKRQVLYRASPFDTTHLSFTLQKDGNVVLTCYNLRAEERTELVLDGRTGEVLETVMDRVPYDDGGLPYCRAHFRVGDREIVLVGDIHTDGYLFDVQENGASILPEGYQAMEFPEYYGDMLLIDCLPSASDDTDAVLLIRPDGDDSFLDIPRQSYDSGTEDFLFFWERPAEGDRVGCVDSRTGESWYLTADEAFKCHGLSTDGVYLITCVPWDEYQCLWRLVYENGRPVGMELINADITK